MNHWSSQRGRIDALLLIGFVIICASTFADAFPAGKERTYNLHNVVRLGDHKNGPTIAYEVTGNVRAGCVWGSDELKLLQFHLTEPRLHLPPKSTERRLPSGFVAQKSYLETAVNRAFFAVWHLGVITKVYVHGKEDPSFINLKKAIISQFQYQLLDGVYDEEDVSGRCQVGYESLSKVNYAKTWHRCESDELVFHRRADRPIGVQVDSSRKSAFKVTNDGTLVEVEANEKHNATVIANPKAGSYLESTFLLKFDGSISNIETIKASTVEEAIKTVKGLKKQTLQTDVIVPYRSRDNVEFKEVVKQLKADLTDEMLGTHTGALALLKCVAAARTTSKTDFLKVLNAHSFKEQKGQFMDILAASQTREAHEAALETLRITKTVDFELSERYLQGLAVGTRPQEWIINDLLRQCQLQFEEPKVHDTLFQTIAAMAFHFARLPKHSYSSPIVAHVEDLLVKSLGKCAEDKKCKELYIRALHNLQSPSAIPVLFEYAKQTERTVAVAAMKAIRDYPTSTWTSSHKKQFQQIFFQQSQRFDSSVRTLALDVMLEQKPNASELADLVQFLRSNEREFEVKKYLLQKLQMFAENCPRFRERFRAIVVAESELNNYHILGQRGVTTAMSRSFSKAPSFNATLLSIQEIYGGVVKRGVVDMSVTAGKDKFSVFTLGIYAGGLSSFVSSNDQQDDDPASDEPATAGMEVSVQGTYFRPLQFFGSQSELMGHAWSGTASEPTDAYTATTLLHDHHEIVRLQNGAGLAVQMLGAVSIDLNGQVQFSLWNRNAQFQVDKNSGIALQGSLAVETSFVNLRSEFTITQEPRLSVLSNVEFSGDPKLCMQISQPETVLRHSIEKTTKVHGTKVVRSTKRSQNYRVAGLSQALNQKNNDMCNVILGDS